MSACSLEPGVWNNILSFLYPFEQCKISQLCKSIKKGIIAVPQHIFEHDLVFWRDNLKQFAEFGFTNINIKDKITILNIDNGAFGALTNEQKRMLMYYLKYHSNLASLYQPIVEKILAAEIDDYAGEFYNEMRYLFALNLSDNGSIDTFEFIIKYIESTTVESNIANPKKCPLLKELLIAGNGLTDNSMALFCKTITDNLSQWNNLRKLDFSDNENISDKHMELLLNSVVVNKCNGLDYLGLEGCALSDYTIDEIYKLCQKHPNKVWIKHLYLKFNDGITYEGEDKITNDVFKDKFPHIFKGMRIEI